ncbi:DegT/DnrJ/EryC1/StrS family aminotransferase [Streptomyces sp. NPDC060194]|uniref:DegT/DnrJ/EryC1/StrS family aminotransferase n=1 Tax=Streptomyces sp. NPDC060194 TaxID=3347069 RepID=UPI0036627734
MGRRLGRECLYVPSGRLGLLLALRHFCPPGGRVLMSPVNDDVILFVVLAAGLRPVQAPLRTRDGTIDADAVPEETWRGLSAVLTTHLYGNPDPAPALRARCDALGIPLLEDAAHAIGTAVGGRPAGTWGDAAAFSLSKHVHAHTGGFLALADPSPRAALARARDDLLLPHRVGPELAYAVRPYAETVARRLRLTAAVWAALRLVGLDDRPGDTIRMPLREDALKEAVAAVAPEAPPGDALDAFDPWVRVDLRDYRVAGGRTRARRVARRFARLDAVLDAHRAGTAKLLATPWADPGAVERPLFRVPLLVADRDRARAALARERIAVGYLYDPPLDVYAGPAFTDASPAPGPAAWFARHALPVDPLRADDVVRVLRAAGTEPAAVPAGGWPAPPGDGPADGPARGAGD